MSGGVPSKIRVPTRCPVCGHAGMLLVERDGYHRWISGELVQRALPDLTPSEREQLMTGIDDVCWERLFGGEEEESGRTGAAGGGG